ncbi:MAG: hypothetical protein LBS71_02270 [Puniceicoccales bacterium]|jgi:tyrosine-specific transport protein|nr:hypothetical protein [Puniceicoccales bacterium]
MNKQLGAILMVAGTAIGGGVIALPIMMAKLGIVWGTISMIFIWLVVYYTALVNIELNLHAKEGLTLGQLGALFSGKIASFLGVGSLKILMFSLMSVYIYGLTSLVKGAFGLEYAYFPAIAIPVSLCLFLILLSPIHYLDYFNRVLFIGILAIAGVLLLVLSCSINVSNMPLLVGKYSEFSSWRLAIPVLFTSFGFQVLFHTLSNYCNMDKNILNKVFLWGSLLPVVVYIIWTVSALCIIYDRNPDLYASMVAGKIDVDGLVKELSLISGVEAIHALVWGISFLAIATSALGVGIGLRDSIELYMGIKVKWSRLLAAMITVAPPCIVAIVVPNAFIVILGFAGMILSFLAILLPIYILIAGKFKTAHYPSTRNKWILAGSFITGILIIAFEIGNLFLK